MLDPQERPPDGGSGAEREDPGPPIGVGASGAHGVRRLDLAGAPEHWAELVRGAGAAPPGPVPPPPPRGGAPDEPVSAEPVPLHLPVDTSAPVDGSAAFSAPYGTAARPPALHPTPAATVPGAPVTASRPARTHPGGRTTGQRHGPTPRPSPDGGAAGPAPVPEPAETSARGPVPPAGSVPPGNGPVRPVPDARGPADGPREAGRTAPRPVYGWTTASPRPADDLLPERRPPAGPSPRPATEHEPETPLRARSGVSGAARLLLRATAAAPRGAPVSPPRQPPAEPSPCPRGPAAGFVQAVAPAAARLGHDPAALGPAAGAGPRRAPSEPVRPAGRRTGAPTRAGLPTVPAEDCPEPAAGPAAPARWPELPHRSPSTAPGEITALTSMLSRLARIEDEQVAR